MISTYLILGAILLLGSVLQSAVGFGFGLLTTPLMVWAGFGLEEAIAIGAGSVFVQLLTNFLQFLSEIRWKEVWVATFYRYLSYPAGVLLLVSLVQLPVATIKQLIGVFVLLVLCVQWIWKVEPQPKLHHGWGVLAFCLSGFISGLIGMGGPPVVLWVSAHNWSARETRAFLFAIFLLGMPVGVALLCYHFGISVLADVGTGVAFAPILIVGSLIGARVGDKLSKSRLRQIAYLLLVCIALTSIVAPLLSGK